MTGISGKPKLKQHTSLSMQIGIIQDDLTRLSQYISGLSELSEEQLTDLDIANQLGQIHDCVKQLETCCLASQVMVYGVESNNLNDEVQFELSYEVGNNWTTVRKEAKRANKLASQLNNSLTKIRSNMDEYAVQCLVPEDIAQINHTVGCAVSELTSDWNSNPY
jgi:hypothetical protein